MNTFLKNIFAIALTGVLLLEPMALSGIRFVHAETVDSPATVSTGTADETAEDEAAPDTVQDTVDSDEDGADEGGQDTDTSMEESETGGGDAAEANMNMANEDVTGSTSESIDTVSTSASNSSSLPDIELTGTSTQATSSTAVADDAAASSTSDAPAAPAEPDEPAASSTSATSTSAAATSTGPTIESGTAVALANILNIINTNLVNSSGNALMLNYIDPVTGTIDLRALGGISTSSAMCALFACAGTDGVSVNLESEGNIQNAVVLNATSGGNEIENADDAVIATGDAYAGLNLINLANTNIIDSNYLLVTMNAFQGVDGDIVFPSLANFLASLASNLAPGVFTINSTANVENDVNANAESGGNETSNTASSTIQTGGSASSGSVFNQINTDMLGGMAVSILFRVQGDWAGEVFGAPEGLQWTQGPDGTIALFDASGGTGSGTQSMAQVTASSTANIGNHVDVLALTGQNRVNNAHSALITTGNALASANVMNIANTNIVGKNWIMAIINIFGDFNGNIAFGRPDLWVGEQVSVPSDVGNGDRVTYTYTVINNGDSPATDVTLTDEYAQDHIRMGDSSSPYAADEDGNAVWELGTIPAGGAVEVTYEGTIYDAPPGTDITNTVTATRHETDANRADDTDTATISIPHPSHHQRRDEPEEVQETAPAADTGAADFSSLSVTRSPASATSDGAAVVHQNLTVLNDRDAASAPVAIHDVLSAPDGTVIHEEVWNVGAIPAGAGVALGYDTSFSEGAPRGTYTLSTVVYSEQGERLETFAGNGTLVLVAPEESLARQAGEVLGSMMSVESGDSSDADGTDTKGDSDSLLTKVFPGIAVAHAAGAGNQAAAAGLLARSWPFLLGIALLLFALLFFIGARRQNDDTRGQGS